MEAFTALSDTLTALEKGRGIPAANESNCRLRMQAVSKVCLPEYWLRSESTQRALLAARMRKNSSHQQLSSSDTKQAWVQEQESIHCTLWLAYSSLREMRTVYWRLAKPVVLGWLNTSTTKLKSIMIHTRKAKYNLSPPLCSSCSINSFYSRMCFNLQFDMLSVQNFTKVPKWEHQGLLSVNREIVFCATLHLQIKFD